MDYLLSLLVDLFLLLHGSETWIGLWDLDNYYSACYQLNNTFVISNNFSCCVINNYYFQCSCYTTYLIVTVNPNLLFSWGLGLYVWLPLVHVGFSEIWYLVP